MRVKNAAFVAILAVVIVVAAAIVGLLPGAVSPPRAGAPPSAAPPSAGSSAPAPSAPGPSAQTAPPGPNEGGQEEGPSDGVNDHFVAPTTAPREPLISAPLPATASLAGAIVKGFPTAIISLAPGSSVVFSSVASDGSRAQAGLNAMSLIAPIDVIAHYSAAFSKLGLVATPAPALKGSTAVAFVRGPSTVTVTVSSAGGGSRYTVFGVLVAGI